MNELDNGPWPEFVRDLKARIKETEKIGWIKGVAFACGFICTDHGQDSEAADMWKESGISKQEARHALEYDLDKFRSAIKGGLPEGRK